jgi:hypothetical protein
LTNLGRYLEGIYGKYRYPHVLFAYQEKTITNMLNNVMIYLILDKSKTYSIGWVDCNIWQFSYFFKIPGFFFFCVHGADDIHNMVGSVSFSRLIVQISFLNGRNFFYFDPYTFFKSFFYRRSFFSFDLTETYNKVMATFQPFFLELP